MISKNESETMTYLQYKREIWRRLIGFWKEFEERHPEWHDYCAPHLAMCQREHARWL